MKRLIISFLVFCTLIALPISIHGEAKMHQEDFHFIGDGYKLVVIVGKSARNLYYENHVKVIVDSKNKVVYLLDCPDEKVI